MVVISTLFLLLNIGESNDVLADKAVKDHLASLGPNPYIRSRYPIASASLAKLLFQPSRKLKLDLHGHPSSQGNVSIG